jgi:Poly(R)-hydroxyalkanoic acid synthase subunit (PHA_synth_III_E)
MVDPQFGTGSPAAFLKAWDDYLAASRAILERLQDPSAYAGGSIPLPIFGAWQDFARSLGMQSGVDPNAGFKPDDLIANLAPALGWSQDYQRIVQRMLKIGGQFQQSYTAFLQQSAAISERALQATLRRTAADPRLASSPVAAYDAWIDSAEAAYAQAAHGESFARSLGELCNLLSAFKVERGKLLDALARHLDIPSRAEVDSLHRQVRDLGAAVRAAGAQPSPVKAQQRKTHKPARK